ncbi:MAG TPA: nitroreductase family protein [Solirubrobacteraceae bacterium]|jgi:nitroreductase|nr:nitroreductase family protein [Solirubrobacteraceae bacterium]
MELEHGIRTRRTHKAFAPEPVEPEALMRLFELARWAPNHHLTNPWRFRVLGPVTIAKLKRIADALNPGSGGKLDRAPTLVVASVDRSGDSVQEQEDLLAGAVAAYLVLLGAHGAGLAGYWRTVPFLDSPAGRDALELDRTETPIGLLHLGRPRQEQRVPERAAVSTFVKRLP